MENENRHRGLLQLDPGRGFSYRCMSSHLIGKVILSNPYTFQERYVKTVLQNSWKCSKDFSVIPVAHNTFVFTFQEHQDCTNVLLNVPWNVKGGLLILSPWLPGQKPADFNFSFSPFWVQVHQLPPEYMTPENGVKIGSVLGKFIYSERHIAPPAGILPARDCLRIRVFLDIRRPLLTRYLVKRDGLSDIYILFRYEDLGVFCFKCGLIGSYHWSCSHPFGEAEDRYNTQLSVPSCSEAPLIKVPQMVTVLRRPPDSWKPRKATLTEESPEKTADTDENVSTREPQMKTEVEESSADVGKEILSLLTKSSESVQEANEKAKEKEKDSEEESSDQMFDANESFPTSSGMQMLVMNDLVTTVRQCLRVWFGER